jgi:hypothetical protein
MPPRWQTTGFEAHETLRGLAGADTRLGLIADRLGRFWAPVPCKAGRLGLRLGERSTTRRAEWREARRGRAIGGAEETPRS